jgi:hypothetical protein
MKHNVMKIYGEWRYSSTFLYLGISLRVSGQLYTPDNLKENNRYHFERRLNLPQDRSALEVGGHAVA